MVVLPPSLGNRTFIKRVETEKLPTNEAFLAGFLLMYLLVYFLFVWCWIHSFFFFGCLVDTGVEQLR